MGKKGGKSVKGQAETSWGEPKTARLIADLTPTGKELLKEFADQLAMSLAEMLERIARGIAVARPMNCKSLKNLIARHWEVLAEYERIPVERLMDLRDGKSEPTELEIARMALALSTSEEAIEAVIARGKDASTETEGKGSQRLPS